MAICSDEGKEGETRGSGRAVYSLLDLKKEGGGDRE